MIESDDKKFVNDIACGVMDEIRELFQDIQRKHNERMDDMIESLDAIADKLHAINESIGDFPHD